MHKKLLVTNIQRMCFQDGPGIRTTVFTKGCSIHCPWCSNPENMRFQAETYEKDGMKGVYGKEYSASELVKILLKDQDFWDDEGGVTFSGGEALMQAEALQDALKELKKHQVHTAVETALFVPSEKLRLVLPYIDFFITDIKILDRELCKNVLGGDTKIYQVNVELAYQSGRLGQFRIPCCPEYTFTEDNKKKLLEFLRQYPDIPVQVFSVHSLGKKKYETLNRPMWESQGVGQDALEEYCTELIQEGIRAEVIHV